MQIQDRHIDIVQKFSMVFHGVTAREKDNYLLFRVFLEESEEEEEPSVRGANDISL